MIETPPSRRELLPGVEGPARVRPLPVHRPHEHVRSARRRAIRRGIIDALILLAVDFFVIAWGDARLPLISRSQTLLLLAIVHFGVICYWYVSRKAPLWRARRIAASWSEAERARFRV